MHLGSDLGAICGIIASVALWIVVTPFVWNRNMEKAVTKLAMLFILVGIIIGIISEVRKKREEERAKHPVKHYTGNETVTVVPLPNSLLTSILPPCRLTRFLTIVRPSPVPSSSTAFALLAL